jgi:predicted acylesterase/phospholipase RssA
MDVQRVVGVSSGALNAVYYANAIRTDTEDRAGERLAELWIEHATVHDAVDLNVHDLFAERGISDASKLVALLRRYVPPSPTVREIDLQLVVTNADGEPSEVAGVPTTTFEHVVKLTARDFTSTSSIERVYAAVAASAALPVLFAPAPLQLGTREVQALDGGLLDDAPIGLALRDAPEVSRVFVIAPFPLVQREQADLHGRAIVSHVFDMLVRERLFRDARAVARMNRALEQLERVLPDPSQRAAVIEAIGWTNRRRVCIVDVRPSDELPGDALSGLWSRELRETYVRAGMDAAELALEQLRHT